MPTYKIIFNSNSTETLLKKMKNFQVSTGFKTITISWGRRKKGKELAKVVIFVHKTY